MTGQGPSQTYRDGFSMGGMSQVIYLALNKQLMSSDNFLQSSYLSTCRISWLMISKVRDHMFLIMLLTSPLRYVGLFMFVFTVLMEYLDDHCSIS